MTIFQAIVLGVVQGITEFLPISSSAHLYLVPYFLGWDYQGLDFDVVLHWGTLLPIVILYGKDYLRYASAVFDRKHRDYYMGWFLVLGTIPAVVFGLLFKDLIASSFRHPLVLVVTLALFGVLLWWFDKRAQNDGHIHGLNWKNVLFIGFGQAIALVPGVSRSGATITAGLASGLTREKAAKFSFLLAGPVIFGAGLVGISDFSSITAPLVAGFLAAAVSGLIAMKLLLKFVQSRSYSIFALYRVFLAVVVLLLVLR